MYLIINNRRVQTSGSPYASFFRGIRSFGVPSCQTFLSLGTGSF